VASDDYLSGLIAEFYDLIEPLTDAVESEDSFRALLLEMGWDLAATPNMGAVTSAFQGVSSAAETLSEDIEGEEDLETLAGDVGGVVVSIASAGAAAAGVANKPAPLDSQDFWSGLADDLVELLVYRYLERHHPFVFGALAFTGTLRLDPKQADANTGRLAYERMTLDFDRLAKTISEPQNLMKDVYGWGGQFDHAKFMRALGAVLYGIGASAAVAPAPAGLLDTFYDRSNESRVDVEAAVATAPQLAAGGPEAFVKPSLILIPVPPPTDLGAVPDQLLLMPYITGGAAVSLQLAEAVKLTLAGEFGTDLVDIYIAPSGVDVKIGGAAGQIGASARVDVGRTPPLIVAGDAASTRLELWQAHLKLGAKGSAAGAFEVEIEAAIDQMKLVLDVGEGDGFLQKVLGGNPQTIELNPGVAWSNVRGFRFMGELRLELELPVHIDIGGVIFIESIYIEIGAGSSGEVEVVLAVTGGLELGPVAASVERMGIAVDAKGADSQNPGNLGPLDLGFGFKLPDGVGMVIDASVVTGGGFIGHKDDEYDGILEVAVIEIVQLKVIGILNTRMPDGSQGFSLLLIITAEFQPIQLSYGFTLNGVGGLAGINRTMVTDVIRAGIRNGTVSSIMFPEDPIKNAPQLISNLRSIFPVAEGRYVFGPMIKIGWGASIITAAVGVLLELPAPIRIVILGQIRVVLPDEDAAVVKVKLDLVGVIEFEKKQISIDASIFDSTIAGLALSGDMAMRLDFGDRPNFALSMGGLHPDYPPPPNFPKLERLTLQFGSGDNPRIAAETYMAVTANSFQVGANLGLHAEAGGFAVDGGLGFDALFIFAPSFSMVAEMHAGVQLLHGKDVLMSVKLEFKFSGPHPWHAQGSASAHILCFEVSVPFDKQWGDPSQVVVAALDAKKPVLDALADPRNWSASLPVGEEPAVTFGDMAAAEDAILVHPMGRLTVRQKVAPLDYTMSLFGNAPASGANRFRIAGSTLGNGQVDSVSDKFAVGQFTKMSDDEKLTHPSYEPFHSGASIGADETTAGHVASLDVRFETTLIDERKQLQTAPLYALGAEKLVLASQSAAGLSMVLNSGAAKFAEPGTTSAVSVESVNYVIAGTEDLSVASALVDPSGVSAAAARELLSRHLAEHPEDAEALQVIPVHEAVAA
jgi:hypothetical protein